MTLRDTLLAVLTMAIWGANFAFAKQTLDQLPPLFMMAVRFALVAALMLPFLPPVEGGWRGPRMWRLLLLSFLLGTLHFGLIFIATKHLEAGTASLLLQVQVPFATLLGVVFFKDRIGWRRILGMGVAACGLLVVFGTPKLDGLHDWAALAMLAALMFVGASAYSKTLPPTPGTVINAWVALLAVPQLALLSLLFESGQIPALTSMTGSAWVGLLYQILLSSVVAYTLWYRLNARYRVEQTTPFLLLNPVFGVLAGVVVRGEDLTWGFVGGAALILAGVAIILIRRPDTVPPASQVQ